jgi:hypothetical protein
VASRTALARRHRGIGQLPAADNSPTSHRHRRRPDNSGRPAAVGWSATGAAFRVIAAILRHRRCSRTSVPRRTLGSGLRIHSSEPGRRAGPSFRLSDSASSASSRGVDRGAGLARGNVRALPTTPPRDGHEQWRRDLVAQGTKRTTLVALWSYTSLHRLLSTPPRGTIGLTGPPGDGGGRCARHRRSDAAAGVGDKNGERLSEGKAPLLRGAFLRRDRGVSDALA